MDFHKDTWQNIIRHHFIKTFLLFGLTCQLGLFQTALGQENGLYVAHSWGTVFGTAGTPDDFLIYDACVADFDSSLIFVVGQSRKADAFKQIPGNSTYFHAKDSLSDAFLACFSTRGQLLWNTYLPAPDSTYLNGSATCVRSFGNRLIVVSNAYPIVISAERTHLNMPLFKGVLCLFEFDQNGELLRSKSFSARYRNRNGLEENFPYVPRIFDIDKWNEDTLMLSGHGIISPADSYGGHGSGVFCRFLADNGFQQTQLLNEVSGTSDQVDHWLHPNLAFSVTFNHSVDLKPSMTCRITNPFSLWRSSNQKNNPSGAVQPSFSAPGYTFSYGYNLQQPPLFAESWQVFSRLIKNRDYFYATPQNTFRYENRDGDLYKGTSAFSGSVQKTADFREYILVQGIHCKNYYNGYFMPNDSTYSSYSHDSTQSFPFMSGKFDKRNPDFTTVPFLLLYNRSSFNENPIPQPDWAAFLDADWLYRDLFSCIDLAHPQNYYMPAAPILLSSGNRFFVIGNATAIGDKSIRGFFSGDKIQNESSHQGLLMAFQSGCPPKLAHIAAPDLICPGDSALLKLPIEYDDYLFVFDSVFLRDGSISVSADSMQAWAKKSGDYHAILSSRLEGCEDAYTDTIRVQALNLAPTPNRYLPQDSILCAHLDLDLQLPDEVSDTYRCFWLDKDSVELPYGHDTSRFLVSGMRGTDGFGANTDTRQPRFFQLKLKHKVCGVSFFDTLLVYDQVKPALELPFHDTVICLNEPVELDSLSPLVYRPFYGFEWSTGEKTSAYSFTDSGTCVLSFFVREDFDFCGYEPTRDTVRTQWSDPALTRITLPEDTSFCERLSLTLDASVPFPSTRYSWQEGMLDDLFSPLDDSTLFTPPVIKVDKDATFALFVVDTMGCVNTRQVNIKEEDCKPQLSIPNVFTPNGDGVNDVLKFKQVEKCFDVDILIVDRKGSHVLHEKVRDPDDFSWNGCYKNGSRKLPDGPYFYLVSYKDAYDRKKVQSGSITILGTSE